MAMANSLGTDVQALLPGLTEVALESIQQGLVESEDTAVADACRLSSTGIDSIVVTCALKTSCQYHHPTVLNLGSPLPFHHKHRMILASNLYFDIFGCICISRLQIYCYTLICTCILILSYMQYKTLSRGHLKFHSPGSLPHEEWWVFCLKQTTSKLQEHKIPKQQVRHSKTILLASGCSGARAEAAAFEETQL